MQSVTEIVVRYAETDRMGIAHHANYLVWFEQARTEYTRKLSCSYSELEKRGLMSPLLSVEVHYLRTCTYEDRLQVICRLVKLSQAQMTFAYTVLREGEEQPPEERGEFPVGHGQTAAEIEIFHVQPNRAVRENLYQSRQTRG